MKNSEILPHADEGYFHARSCKAQSDRLQGLEFNEDTSTGQITVFVHEETDPQTIREAIDEAQIRFGYLDGLRELFVPIKWLEAEDFTAAPVTTPPAEPTFIPALRRIVAEKSMMRIDPVSYQIIPENKRGGVAVDAYSASAVIQVYDLLRPDLKEKLSRMHIVKAVDMSFRAINRNNSKA